MSLTRYNPFEVGFNNDPKQPWDMLHADTYEEDNETSELVEALRQQLKQNKENQ